MTFDEILFYLSLLAVACLFIYLIKIFRSLEEDKSGVQPMESVPVQAMKNVYNPYSVHLEAQKSSFTDGAYLTVRVGQPGYVLACWGATIEDIFPLIYLPGTKFQSGFECRDKAMDVLKHKCCHITCQSLECCSDVTIHLQTTEHIDLGPLPRNKYPLVVIMVADTMFDTFSHEDILFHAVILHLKDDVCPAGSHVISHLVRSKDGKLFDLKQLYTSGNPQDVNYSPTSASSQSTTDRSSSSENHHQENTTETVATMADGENPVSDVCIICQTAAVNKVFLPCRHACVCDHCFTKVDKCPMCREYIHSCFNLEDRQSDVTDIDDEEDTQGQHWLYRLNDRLNTFFGFT